MRLTTQPKIPTTDTRLDRVYELHDEFNKQFFAHRLRSCEISIDDRDDHVHGWFIWDDKLDNEIVLSSRCYEISPDYVESTLLHEMIHQYQVEVLGQFPDHGAIFNSIARHYEQSTNLKIR